MVKKQSKKNRRTPSLIERAVKIADQIEINDIYLLKGEFFRSDEEHFINLKEENTELHFDISSKLKEYVGRDKKVIIHIRLYLSLKNKITEDMLMQIQAIYCLNYTFEPKSKVLKKDLEAFGAINGVYHAWPYWREFVQNATQRMNLPPLTLDVLRIPKKRNKGTQQ